MTIIDAVNFARAGHRVRRAIWRPDLWLEQNYIALNLAVVGDRTQPYTFTIDDLAATDWEADQPLVEIEECKHPISVPSDDGRHWVCNECGTTTGVRDAR